MRLKPYPKYKPSGVEWLGDVPEHWELKRLKKTVRLTDKKVDADEDNPVPYVGMENIESWTGRLLPLNPDIVPTGTANAFKAGHTLFGKLRPYLAKACTPDFDGLCSTELLVLDSIEFDRVALRNALLSDGFIKLVDSSTYGSKMPRASWDFIGNCVLPLPSNDEQRAIARFLDVETSRIDCLVFKKRELIERLREKRTALISRTVTRGLPPAAARAAGLPANPPLKPSGIDWLGDIPERWAVKKFGHISVIVRGASPRPAGDPRYFDGDFIPWITVGEVTKDEKVFLTGTETMLTEEGAANSRTIRSGTLVLTNSGATLGVPKILAITGCANDGIVVFEGLSKASNKLFLYYFLKSLTANLRDRIKQGSGQPNLNTDIVRSLNIPLPPLQEQTAIAAYLDTETAKLDALVAKVEEAIERLQEYRTALITAAVTGKIDVRSMEHS
ncbi:MAG: restriction endonuclease subunit S [Pirellulaceae bacterium]|nr:restriction endonuclease subunit S [Pirellulaceae bacterium]